MRARYLRAGAGMSSKPAAVRARAEQMIAVLREFGPIDEKGAAALLRWTNTRMTRNPRAKDKVFDFVFQNGQTLDWLLDGKMDGLIRWQYRARDYKMPPDQK